MVEQYDRIDPYDAVKKCNSLCKDRRCTDPTCAPVDLKDVLEGLASPSGHAKHTKIHELAHKIWAQLPDQDEEEAEQDQDEEEADQDQEGSEQEGSEQEGEEDGVEEGSMSGTESA
jgi:hypothetical protein